MKKILKSFTFWLIMISLFEIYMHRIGQDSKSIALIHHNPLLKIILDSRGALCEFMKGGYQVPCNSMSGYISINWYIGSVLTFALYGIVLDLIKSCVLHKHSPKS